MPRLEPHPRDVVMLGDGVFSSASLYTPQRMAAAIARSRRVLYVDPPYAARAILRRPIPAFNRPLRQVSKGLFVLTPPVPLPDRAHYYGPLRSMACGMEKRYLDEAIGSLGMGPFTLWAYSPYDVSLLDSLHGAMVVFEYKDEISSFPAHRPPRRARALERLEHAALGRADLVFTPTEILASRKRAIHPRVHAIPFGVDRDHFAKARLVSTEIPDDVRRLPRPIIGYVGSLDAYKVDFGLIEFLAADHPEASFVFVGPVGVTDGTIPADLPRKENLFYLGPRSHDVLPAYMKAFDVCIVPHRTDGYGETNFPFKVLEYLAAGRPVVATDLPAVRDLGPVVRRARTPQEFSRRIGECLEGAGAGTDGAARCWSWEERAERMLAIVDAFDQGRERERECA